MPSASKDGRPTLPPALEGFLARFPHPVFALPARPLYDSLVARKRPFAPADTTTGSFHVQQAGQRRQSATEQYEGGQDSVVHAAAKQSSRPGAASNTPVTGAATRSNVARSSPSSSPSPSLSSTSSPAPSSNVSSSTPASRAHIKNAAILSKAFDGPEQISRGYPALQRNTLLEGGEQASHDPSRTAEGAVNAMLEQRARYDQHELEEDAAEAHREEEREAGREEREKEEQKEFEQSDRPHGSSVSLGELLRPIWRNGKWREAMAIRDDARTRSNQSDGGEVKKKNTADGPAPKQGEDGEGDEELDLLSLLSRADAQELMAMLANVVEHLPTGGKSLEQRQQEVPLAKLDHTVLLELNFPPSSIYRLPTLQPSSLKDEHAARPSTGATRSQPILPRNPPSRTARPHAIYSPANSYAAPPPDQNPPVIPPHHGVQHDSNILKPFLQVVASLHEDLIICTTILANMPLPVSMTDPEPSNSSTEAAGAAAEDKEEKQQPVASAPQQARPALTPTISETRLSRPPLPHRHTSRSTLSAASSSGSTAVPPDETTSAATRLLSTVDPAALLRPRPTDITPQPLQQWFERGEAEEPPSLLTRATTLDEETLQQTQYPRRLPIEMPGVLPGGGGDGTAGGIAYPEARTLEDAEEDATAPLRNLFVDSYTADVYDFPKGFVREKESRAQRRGGTPKERRERDNDDREREWQKRIERDQRREREKKVAREVREREGLGELRELNEDEDLEDKDDIKAYDEEDERDLERLRHKTRTGSTSSAGSTAPDRMEDDLPHESPVLPALPPPYQNPPQTHSPEVQQSPRSPSPPPQSSASSASLSGRAGPTVHDGPPSRPMSEIAFGDPFLDTVAQTPCGRLILAFNWSGTSLGPIHGWGPELRSQVMLMLSSPFHEALWMGEDNVLLYNDAYSRILGTRHPAALGKAGAMGWSEVWDVLGPLASEVMRGKTVSFADHCLSHVRNGQLEETYHSWAYITLRDSRGKIIGYTNPSFETTARVIAERRLGTLRELTQLTSLARTTRDFCSKALRGLSTNALDLPFSILYTCEPVTSAPGRRTKGSTDSSGMRRETEAPTSFATDSRTDSVARMKLTRQGAVGVPNDHSSARHDIEVLVDLSNSGPAIGGNSSASSVSSATGSTSTTDSVGASTVWPFVEALQSRKPVFISDVGQRAQGFTPRGWPEPVKRAVVIPVMTDGSSLPKALLIVGLNPRRPWNEVYATFLNLIARGLSTGLLGIEVAEEQARKSAQLQELNDARQAFFSNISHELRTPLALILGPLEDVLHSGSAGLKGEDRDKLDVVHRNASRLLNMVNTLLDFSRLESGRMNSMYCPMLLGPAIVDLAGLFRAAIERGGIDFVVSVEEDKYAEKSPFYLSSEMLEKLLFNILGNAFKYTLAGKIAVIVKFSPSDATIAVSDTGVGIKDEHLNVIFDRFHRIDSSARSFEGSGIGLSLVLELVKALGGTIDVNSEFGKGTTFTVRLPRGSAHLPPDAVSQEPFESFDVAPRSTASLSIINDAAAWRVESKPLTPSVNAEAASSVVVRRPSDPEPIGVFQLEKANTTVLVVDDNAQLRAFIGGILSKMFTVVEASDGSEALQYALNNPVSLVVTDVAMPVMSGYELLRALRANASTNLVPVIFLSAQAGPEARVNALLESANDFLTKPFQARELVARVNVHLQLYAMRRELEKRVEERTAELVDSERKLRELADQHQTLAQVSPVGIFQAAPDGKMLFVNPQFLEISGHPPDAPHEEWEKDIDPADLPRVRSAWAEAIADWRPDKGSSTFEFKYRNGNWTTLQVRSYDRGYIGSITDISHQKEVEQLHLAEVEQRATEAEENRRNTEAFLDMASHELRNPLSGVWQNAEVVAGSLEKYVDFLEGLKSGRSATPVSVEEHLQEVLEDIDAVENVMLCCEHQRRIADDILNVSKLNMGLLSIQVAPFDLSAALREVVKTFEVQAAQQDIQLRVDEGASLAQLNVDWIVADRGRVKQIIYNFLTNALKYTTDSPRKTVTVHVEAFDKAPPAAEGTRRIACATQSFEPPPDCIWVQIGIEDSGKGLTPEQLEVLFARFAQANPRTDQYGGSGLGLYVSKKLVELHRGYIEVASRFGSGSTFSFVIPASRAARPPPSQVALLSPAPMLGQMQKRSKRPTSSSGRAPTAVPSPLTSPSGVPSGVAPIHVLVAEDNLVNQKVLLRQLKNQGFEVTLASDGKQALDALDEDDRRYREAKSPLERYNCIRVVLCDIEMPVMDGLEFVKYLRERERGGVYSRKYPACAVTGNAREEKKAECLTAGFDDVATKPYRLSELLQQISRLTGLPVSAPR